MTCASTNPCLQRATEIICRQGMIPFPAGETARAIVAELVGGRQEALELIIAFDQASSQTLDQLAASSGKSPETVDALASALARIGLIFNQPNSAGIMVYRLLPLMMAGVLEYRFMGPLSGSESEKTLALLFEKLVAELRDQVQSNYDALPALFGRAPAVDRTVAPATGEGGRAIRVVPVQKPLQGGEEVILPSQTVNEIIDKFDDIAVGHCFCRQRRRLLGEPCLTQAPTLNCFTFGKSARHTAAQGFAQKIDRKEARRIMQEAEAAGLIHKAFHPGSRETSPETSICNCCKDCCDTFRLWRDGTLPMINSTYHLALIDEETCVGCGICMSWCPTDAITLADEGVAIRDEQACIGCGLCARFCPEGAVALQEGLRRVFVMPPRLRA